MEKIESEVEELRTAHSLVVNQFNKYMTKEEVKQILF